MFNRYTIIFLVLGFLLSPFVCREQMMEGRLILAPPRFVRQQLFDANFVSSILRISGSDSFFYPSHIREQLDKLNSKERHDPRYAQEVADMHAGFESDVTIVPTSVVHRSAAEGSFWTGQKIKHEFVFSERAMNGENGTYTVFEYSKAWHTSFLLYTLHNKDLLPSWLNMESNRQIDRKGVDLFRVEVEKAWKKRAGSIDNGSSQFVLA